MWVMMLVMAFPLLGVALFFALPWPAALILYAAGLALSLVFHRAMMTSMMRPVATGRRGMLGGTALVAGWDSGRGTVRFQGELWRARGEVEDPFERGTVVRIVRVDGLELVVARPPAAGATVAAGSGPARAKESWG